MSKQQNITSLVSDLENATGEIKYRPTNDVIFHMMLERSEETLRNLLCSLLCMKPSDISSVEICNPLGDKPLVDSKEFILDVKLILNNRKIINIELQLLNEGDWPERSLSYLCRNFDSLKEGDDYSNVKEAHHIGILDFTLFKDYPEFYAQYHLRNDKLYYMYTGKFSLSVLDLTHIDLASDEDKLWKRDKWAELFRAKTWEELRMLAEQNSELKPAASIVRCLNEDEAAIYWAQSHEEAVRRNRAREARYKKKDEEFAAKEELFAAKESEFAAKESEFAAKESEFAAKESEFAAKEELFAVKESEFAAKESEFATKEADFAAREAALNKLIEKYGIDPAALP